MITRRQLVTAAMENVIGVPVVTSRTEEKKGLAT